MKRKPNLEMEYKLAKGGRAKSETFAAADTGKVEMKKPQAGKGAEALMTAAEAVVPFFGATKSALEGEYQQAMMEAGLDVAGGPLAKGLGAAAPMLAGIFIGPKSKIWDKTAAKKFLKMEKAGAAPEEIWRQTGTFRSPDGILRQEVNDAPSRLRRERMNDIEDEYGRLRNMKIAEEERIEEKLKRGLITPEEARQLWESTREVLLPQIRDISAEYSKAGKLATPGELRKRAYPTLEQTLYHPEAFKAYPELKYLRTEYKVDPSEIPEGSMSYKSGETSWTRQDPWKLYARGRTTPEARGVMLHEMQHGIQHMENMGLGGNPAKEWGMLPSQMHPTDYVEQLQRTKQSLIDELDALRQQIPPGGFGFSLNPKPNPIIARSAALSGRIQDLEQALRDIGGKNMNPVYRRMAGEAEARAVTSRMNMTPGERFAKFPLESYDIPVDELIVRTEPYANGGLLNKAKQVAKAVKSMVDDEPKVSRINMNYKDVTKRVPQLTEAAQKVARGEMSPAQYDALVQRYKPVQPYEFVPQPATQEDAMRALRGRQKERYGKTAEIPAGTPVGLRLDIPAYQNHGVWINSIHPEGMNTYYGPVSSAKNVTMSGAPEQAFKVATGEKPKGPWARIQGEWNPISEEEAVQKAKEYLNNPEWVQIGYDPERHGYFYDRRTMQPVLGAEEVLQIGPLVLGKSPKYGTKASEKYADGGEVHAKDGGNDWESLKKLTPFYGAKPPKRDLEEELAAQRLKDLESRVLERDYVEPQKFDLTGEARARLQTELEKLMPRGSARRATSTMLGGEGSNLPFGIGMADVTPAGLPLFGFESGQSLGRSYEAAKRGDVGEAALEGGMGALGVLPAMPGALRMVKGAAKATEGMPVGLSVKPVGGQWLKTVNKGPVETRRYSGAVTPEYVDARRTVAEDWRRMAAENPTRENIVSSEQMDDMLRQSERELAVNQWIDSNLQNYVRKQMGTPEDPILKLAEQGILHMPYQETGLLKGVAGQRFEAGFPMEGMATTDLGRMWENLSDREIKSISAGKLRDPNYLTLNARKASDLWKTHFENPADRQLTGREAEEVRNFGKYAGESSYERLMERNPWLSKLDPETPIYDIPQSYDAGQRLGFDHVIDVLNEDMAAGRLRSDQLSKMSVEQAVRRTAEYDAERAAAMAKAAAQDMKGMTVAQEFDDGFKMVQLDKPGQFAKESDSMGHSVRGYEPRKGSEDWIEAAGNSGYSGYGHGGWDAIKGGEAQVFSLRDAKNNPHVTIEVSAREFGKPPYEKAVENLKKAGYDENQMADILYQNGYIDDRGNVLPDVPAITQIKGKQNAAPNEEYLPMIQKFIRDGNYVVSGDLRNAGLIDTKTARSWDHGFSDNYVTLQDALPAGAPRYVTESELERVRRTGEFTPDPHLAPQPKKTGGAVIMKTGGKVKPDYKSAMEMMFHASNNPGLKLA